MKYANEVIQNNDENICPVCGRYDTVQWDIDYGVEERLCLDCDAEYKIYYDMQIEKICRGDVCYDGS